MDLIIVILLIIVGAIFYKDGKFVVYLIGAMEVFFRLIHYIGDHIKFINLNSFINKVFPSSLFSMFRKYSSGIIYSIIAWTLVLAFILFLYYLIIYLIKKK